MFFNTTKGGTSVANIIVLEDDSDTIEFISKLISENWPNFNIFKAKSIESYKKILEKNIIHIALLDIELGKDSYNGLDVGKYTNKYYPEIKIIFLTGYDQYALTSFAIHPYDYILKPINIARFKNTINRLLTSLEEEKCTQGKLIIKNKNEIYFIRPGNIIYIEKAGKDTIIHEEKENYLAKESLSYLEDTLGGSFIRVHKSYLVNKNKILRIKEIGDRVYEIEFYNSSKVAYMSRMGFSQLKRYFPF